MNSLLKKIRLVVIYLILVGVIGYLVWEKRNTSGVKYVDTITLYNNFELTKKMQSESQPLIADLKSTLDSLRYIYSNNEKLQGKKDVEKEISRAEQEYLAINEESNQEINKIIWNRLNPLINSFGKKHDYDIIVGANGMGNVLYGKEAFDITQEVLIYCNKEYRDEN